MILYLVVIPLKSIPKYVSSALCGPIFFTKNFPTDPKFFFGYIISLPYSKVYSVCFSYLRRKKSKNFDFLIFAIFRIILFGKAPPAVKHSHFVFVLHNS